jgi:hypothetical protein
LKTSFKIKYWLNPYSQKKRVFLLWFWFNNVIWAITLNEMFRYLFLTLTHSWRLFQSTFIRTSESDILSALRDCQLSIQVFVSYWMLMVNVECCLNNICFRKIIEVFIFISCIDFLFINKSESPFVENEYFLLRDFGRELCFKK